MATVYKDKLSEEKIEQVLNSLQGLTNSQWRLIKSVIDYVYSEKAAKIEIDSSDEVETIKSLLKL
ncbi:hypothetical protein [Tissierella praeacuta]|uniref:hypothetical protein n=1 Tax=Tissierella praeacuta TaxID=43131 RepID=UPI0028A87323|nr:hypothetical protein [Tissierella praeacuta]